MRPASRCRVAANSVLLQPEGPGAVLKVAGGLCEVVDVAGVEVGVTVRRDDGVALLQDRGYNLGCFL